MSRIDQLPEHRARLPKSTHDLSHRFGFTATVAHLLPVFHTFMNPGETIKLGVNFNLRTQPFEAAAMSTIRSHVEYFFVPIQLLYQPFENMYYNVNEQFSSMFPSADSQLTVQSDLPVLDFKEVQDFIANHCNRHNYTYVYDTYSQTFGDSVGQQYVRLMDMLGFRPNLNSRPGQNQQWNPNVFPYQLLAYHCIYQYYYRLDNREQFYNTVFNWDRFFTTPTVQGQSDNFYYEMFKIHYRPLGSDYFTDVKVSPIVDNLNMNGNSMALTQDWLAGNTNVSPIAASQNNGILTTLQQSIGSGGAGATGEAVYDDVQSYVKEIGTLTTKQARTNMYLTGNMNSTGSTVFDTFMRSGDVLGSVSGYPQRIESPHTHSLESAGASVLNTANLRALFAQEKLLSITGRAKKNYDAQTLAHFGVKVPHDVKHEISCFGHDQSEINIGEVIATAGTEQTALGEIAGKGYGRLQSKMHKFTAPCHGVVMAILSFVPDVNYQDTFGKYNVVTGRNDLFVPEYDHLGMQPLFRYECEPAANTDETPGVQETDIMGWQYRYEQWKRRYNRVSMAFDVDSQYEVPTLGSLSSWILSRVPYGKGQTNSPSNNKSYINFLYNPADLNQLVLYEYSNNWSSDMLDNPANVYMRDPFVIDSYISCKLVSEMSDYSMPRLDA